jgi:sec-independent protein translocase protein TatB
MFDIGFPELLVVGIVALLVIGPDKLPETVRTIALWVGRIRRALSDIKSEIEDEIGADEIRRQLHNESIMKEINKTRNQIGGMVKDAEAELSDIKESTLPSARNLASANEQQTTPAPEAEATQESANQPEEDDGRKQSESGR